MEELWRLRHRLLMKKRRYPVGPSKTSPTSSQGAFPWLYLRWGASPPIKPGKSALGTRLSQVTFYERLYDKKKMLTTLPEPTAHVHALIVSSWIDNPAGWAKALIWRKVGPDRTRRWPTASKKGSPTSPVTFLTEPSKKVWPGSR